MENKLHTFEKSLDKLNLVDVNKFSTTDFKSVNKDIETQLNNFKELLDIDNQGLTINAVLPEDVL